MQMTAASLTIQNAGVEIVGKDLKYTKLIVTGVGSDGGMRKHTVNHVLWSEWPDKVRLFLLLIDNSPV